MALNSTRLTEDQIDFVIKKLENNYVKLQSYLEHSEVKNVVVENIGKDMGFNSTVFKLTIYMTDPAFLPLTVVVKTLSINREDLPLLTVGRGYRCTDRQAAHTHFCYENIKSLGRRYCHVYENTSGNEPAFDAFLKTLNQSDQDSIRDLLKHLRKTKSVEFLNYVALVHPQKIGLPMTLRVFVGSLAFDIAHLITICTDNDTRYYLETFILDFYYKTFAKLLKEKGHQIKFTVDQVHAAYRLCKAHLVHVLVKYMPTFTSIFHASCDSTKAKTRSKCLLEQVKALLLEAKEILLEDAPEWLA
uniref:Uncharacterized protein n=1 Tax=Ditylenchus dipsaci TaxID=166011 RepID=A0A915ESX3_9BILA